MTSYKDLNDKQINFIEAYYKSMSDKQISKKLNISRHAVRNYREKLLKQGSSAVAEKSISDNPATTISFFPRNPKILRITAITIFFLILLLSLNLRKHTFNLPHYRGDQHHYVGLAFKLDEKGMAGYNLRGIDILSSRQYPNLIILSPSSDKGYVIKSLAKGGITYYDEPLHHVPFGFPLALMISHKIFAHGQPYSLLYLPNDNELLKKAPLGVGLKYFRFPKEITGKQFYSIIVPLFFSLVFISSVYFLAKILFNNEFVALAAMFLIAISPIDILTSQKIWADDMTAAFGTLGILFYLLARKKEKLLIAFVSGVFCGLGALTKQNGTIVILVLIFWHFLSNLDLLFKKDTCLKVIFDKYLVLFGVGCIFGAGYWYIKLMLTYGDPLYRPFQPKLAETAKTIWFKLVSSRPKYLYFAGIPYQNPIFGLAYLSPIWLLLDKKNIKKILLPLLWILITFYLAYKFHIRGEHRYLLPTYPAFAILGAYALNQIRIYIDKLSSLKIGTVLFILSLIFSLMWSVPMGLEAVFYNQALIIKPF